MELAITDAEKEFFVMMNNYFDAIDKAVEDKQQGRKTDFKEINFLAQLYTLLYKGFCIMTGCASHK